MSDKLLLLDKDGTIVESSHPSGFINEPWHQKIIHPAQLAIQQAYQAGWDIKICSNQGGVAAGHKSLEKCFQEMHYCLELFPEISEAYFCPDFEGEICWYCWGECSEDFRIERKRSDSGWYPGTSISEFPSFRKPGAGMLLAAANLDYDHILYVGDRPEDQGAAQAANMRFMWAEEWRFNSQWLNV